MSFGSRLKELRKERHFSQREVAAGIGVSVTAISQYESDSRFPNEAILRQFCLYYQISSDYLLGLTNEKHAPLSREEVKEKMITPKQMGLMADLLELIKAGKENR